MSEQANADSLNLQLWFEKVLVANLFNVKPHQGTWFALYRRIVAPEQGTEALRLCEYITFCEDWHQLLKHGHKPDATEFERFADVIYSSSWRVPCPGGAELTMTEGPIFVEGEASWNHPEAEPSRELAAWQTWVHLTRRIT